MRNMQWIAPILLVAVALAGCQSNRKPKAAAMKQWNDVRSSVLATLAQRQFRSGELDPARKSVDRALGMTPESPSLHILSARIALAQGQLESAQKDLDEVRRLDPDNAEADYYSGIVYQRWQKPELALSYYASAARKAPSKQEYVLAQAEMLVAQDEAEEALALLQEKLGYFEHSAALRDAVGSLLMQKREYARAAGMFGQASIYAQDDSSIREHLALALYFSRQYSQAVGVLQRLLGDKAYQSRPDLQTAMGECLMHLGRPRDALGHLQQAAQLDAHQPAVWLDLAQVMVELNRPDDARLALGRALKLAPQSGQAHLLMGYIALHQNRLPEALAAFQNACRADPSDSTGMCMMGQVLQKMGDTHQARQWYSAALKANPGDELAARMLASLR